MILQTQGWGERNEVSAILVINLFSQKACAFRSSNYDFIKNLHISLLLGFIFQNLPRQIKLVAKKKREDLVKVRDR